MSRGKPVRFGPFEADVTSGELRKHGTPVRLQEQPARILRVLLEHHGEVVSREELVKLLWPDGTFVDFDRGLNAAVNRLRQALSDSAESPRYVETVARRGYRFIAAVETPVDQPESAVQARAPGVRKWMAAVGGLLVVVTGAWLWLRPNPETENTARQPVPLTSYEGVENYPSFSPDGTQVAFSWNGPKQDNTDIYVKVIGSDPPLRLTTDPADDTFPAWSPDGRYIAFYRAGQGILLVAPTGGPEQPLVAPPVFPNPMSWSMDGRYVAFSRDAQGVEPGGIFLADVRSGGAVRRLTRAEGAVGHCAPAFAPDGRSIAFASCTGTGGCGLRVMEIDDAIHPRGGARLRWQGSDMIQAVAWSADSRSIVFSVYALERGLRLFEIRVPGSGNPQPLMFAAPGAAFAALSRGNRLSYSSFKADHDLWQWRDGEFSRNSMSSTFSEGNPQYSPDGSRVAFASMRSGPMELWVANADGSGSVRLTTSRSSGSPRWSPDGRQLVYDTQNQDGTWDVMISDTAGGQAKTVARTPVDEDVPSFSHDGRWIYFSSNRGGNEEIYRVPTAGGDPVRLTDAGGWVAFESMDGESVYYSKANLACTAPLFVRQISGGPERQVVDSVCGRGFAVTRSGIFYTSGPDRDGRVAVRLLDPATGGSREVARADGPFYGYVHLAVSPDMRTILLAASRTTQADLYLVENFR